MNRRSFFTRIVATLAVCLAGARWVWANVSNRKPHQLRLPGFIDEHIPPARYRDRLRWNIHERIWVRLWERENNPPDWLNSGIGILAHCLDRDPTPEEKTAVAGVIQWFGSNCGHAFICEVLEAQGYKVLWDQNPNWKRIQALQDLKLGPLAQDLPELVKVRYRGRMVNV